MIVDNEVERYLTLLRNKIREKGFTQLQVQEALSWGRSYISQLLTKQKSLRVEQVLLILDVIGVEPADFFAELYYYPGSGLGGYRSAGGYEQAEHPLAAGFEEMRTMVRGLVWLLIDKEMIDADELTETVKAHKKDALADDGGPEVTH